MSQNPKLTLDQQRAKYAWEKSEEAAKVDIDKYTNLAKSVPSLIMNSGLMQTLAFLQSKIDKKYPQYEILLIQMCKWLGRTLGGTQITNTGRFPPQEAADFPNVMTALYNSPSGFYMRATDEAMALLRWISQFADARKSMENKP